MEQKIYEAAVAQLAAFHNDWNCSCEAAATRLTKQVMGIIQETALGLQPLTPDQITQTIARACQGQNLIDRDAVQAASEAQLTQDQSAFLQGSTQKEVTHGTGS